MQLFLAITNSGQTHGFNCQAEIAMRLLECSDPPSVELTIQPKDQIQANQIVELLPAKHLAIELDTKTPPVIDPEPPNPPDSSPPLGSTYNDERWPCWLRR